MENTLVADITKQLEKINLAIIDETIYQQGIGLYSGAAGRCLLMGLNYEITKNELFLNKVYELLNYTIEQIENGENLNFSFSAGIPGWCWTIQYLVTHNIVKTDLYAQLKEIDKITSKHLSSQLKHHDYDPLNGAIGIGRYFLSRGNKKEVTKVINYLINNKEEQSDEVRWLRISHDKEVTFYDFGLAHGITGILYFLGGCYKANIMKSECYHMILKATNFLTNNIQDVHKVGAYFPNRLNKDDYILGKKESNLSRLAWCYGDLSIWFTLYKISELINDRNLQKTSLDCLLDTSNRKSFENTKIVDPGFCHGTSGVAYIYLKLWISTKNEAFKAIATYWYEQTLKSDKGEGYQYLLGNFENRDFIPSNNLLEGDTGLALTYLSYLNQNLTDWDECLMLS